MPKTNPNPTQDYIDLYGRDLRYWRNWLRSWRRALVVVFKSGNGG